MIGCPVTCVMDNAAPTYAHNQWRPPIRGVPAYLVVHRVPLGNQHAVNAPARARRRREIAQRAVEFGQLVNGFVAHQGFADKDNLVGRVNRDKLMPCQNVRTRQSKE